MQRKLVGILLVLTLVLSACIVPVGVAAAGQYKIVIENVPGFYEKGLTEIFADYEKLHPEVTLSQVMQGNDTYMSYLNSRLTGDRKDAPDIILPQFPGIQNAKDQKMLVNLTKYMTQKNPYSGKTLKSILPIQWLRNDQVNADGVQWGLPYDNVGTGIYYNTSIFAKLKLKEPKTYEEMLADFQKIQKAGYTAIAGSSTSVGWLQWFTVDQAAKKYVPSVMARKGDWNWDDATCTANLTCKYNVKNGNFDKGVVMNGERVDSALKGGTINLEGQDFVESFQYMQNLAKYFQPGFFTAGQTSAYALFVSGQAACYLSGSWELGSMIKDLGDLPADKKFDFSVFQTPPITKSKTLNGPVRGIFTTGHQWAIIQKNDPAQEKRVMDFIWYLYSPKVAQKIWDVTLAAGQFVQGPSLVPGVKLPKALQAKLVGFAKYPGMFNVYFAVNEDRLTQLTAAWQSLLMGEITPAQYCKTWKKLQLEQITVDATKYDLDFDPTTKNKQ